jgi:hypothetical protein
MRMLCDSAGLVTVATGLFSPPCTLCAEIFKTVQWFFMCAIFHQALQVREARILTIIPTDTTEIVTNIDIHRNPESSLAEDEPSACQPEVSRPY